MHQQHVVAALKKINNLKSDPHVPSLYTPKKHALVGDEPTYVGPWNVGVKNITGKSFILLTMLQMLSLPQTEQHRCCGCCTSRDHMEHLQESLIFNGDIYSFLVDFPTTQSIQICQRPGTLMKASEAIIPMSPAPAESLLKT